MSEVDAPAYRDQIILRQATGHRVRMKKQHSVAIADATAVVAMQDLR